MFFDVEYEASTMKSVTLRTVCVQCQLRRSFSTSGQFHDLFNKHEEFKKSRENTNAKLQPSFLFDQDKYKKDTDRDEQPRQYQQSSLQSSRFSHDRDSKRGESLYTRQQSHTKQDAKLRFRDGSEFGQREYGVNLSQDPPKRIIERKKFSETKERNSNIKLTSKTRLYNI